VIVTDVLFTVITLGLNLFAMWLMADVQTREAFIFAPFLVAASLILAGKGADLLHRKWSEYEAMENERLGRKDITEPNVLPNPMLDVARLSKQLMAICDATVVLMLAPVTLLMSFDSLANSAPDMLWPVTIASSAGCAMGVLAWIVAPSSNNRPARRSRSYLPSTDSDDGE
jgi:hypothetical protein